MREEFLRLRMHEDGEISEIIGKSCVCEKLHHWPLSCVMKVTAGDGERYIYKAQRSGVEAEFFRAVAGVDAPFLIRPIYSEKFGDTDVMMFPFIDHETGGVSDGEHLDTVRSLRSEIALLEEASPLWMDISTPEKFAREAETTARTAGNLLDANTRDAYVKWAGDSDAFYEGGAGFIHGDLSTGNILRSGTEHYIIDWQRPLRGPLVLEEVCAFPQERAGEVFSDEMRRLIAGYQALWFTRAWREYMPELDGIREHGAKLICQCVK
jgi:hypothetical protein